MPSPITLSCHEDLKRAESTGMIASKQSGELSASSGSRTRIQRALTRLKYVPRVQRGRSQERRQDQGDEDEDEEEEMENESESENETTSEREREREREQAEENGCSAAPQRVEVFLHRCQLLGLSSSARKAYIRITQQQAEKTPETGERATENQEKLEGKQEFVSNWRSPGSSDSILWNESIHLPEVGPGDSLRFQLLVKQFLPNGVALDFLLAHGRCSPSRRHLHATRPQAVTVALFQPLSTGEYPSRKVGELQLRLCSLGSTKARSPAPSLPRALMKSCGGLPSFCREQISLMSPTVGIGLLGALCLWIFLGFMMLPLIAVPVMVALFSQAQQRLQERFEERYLALLDSPPPRADFRPVFHVQRLVEPFWQHAAGPLFNSKLLPSINTAIARTLWDLEGPGTAKAVSLREIYLGSGCPSFCDPVLEDVDCEDAVTVRGVLRWRSDATANILCVAQWPLLRRTTLPFKIYGFDLEMELRLRFSLQKVPFFSNQVAVQLVAPSIFREHPKIDLLFNDEATSLLPDVVLTPIRYLVMQTVTGYITQKLLAPSSYDIRLDGRSPLGLLPLNPRPLTGLLLKSPHSEPLLPLSWTPLTQTLDHFPLAPFLVPSGALLFSTALPGSKPITGLSLLKYTSPPPLHPADWELLPLLRPSPALPALPYLFLRILRQEHAEHINAIGVSSHEELPADLRALKWRVLSTVHLLNGAPPPSDSPDASADLNPLSAIEGRKQFLAYMVLPRVELPCVSTISFVDASHGSDDVYLGYTCHRSSLNGCLRDGIFMRTGAGLKSFFLLSRNLDADTTQPPLTDICVGVLPASAGGAWKLVNTTVTGAQLSSVPEDRVWVRRGFDNPISEVAIYTPGDGVLPSGWQRAASQVDRITWTLVYRRTGIAEKAQLDALARAITRKQRQQLAPIVELAIWTGSPDRLAARPEFRSWETSGSQFSTSSGKGWLCIRRAADCDESRLTTPITDVQLVSKREMIHDGYEFVKSLGDGRSDNGAAILPSKDGQGVFRLAVSRRAGMGDPLVQIHPVSVVEDSEPEGQESRLLTITKAYSANLGTERKPVFLYLERRLAQ